MIGEILMIAILAPLAVFASLVIPFYIIQKGSNFLSLLFPHIKVKRIENFVTITVVIIWIILAFILSILV